MLSRVVLCITPFLLCRNFLPINVPNYGNCFIFNTALNDEDIHGGQRVTSLTGPTFGLSMVLSLEQRNYMRQGQSKQAGARLVINSPDLNPLVDEEGMDLFPSTLTHASIQETSLTRQPWPYTSECIDSWSGTNYTVMEDVGVVPYSLSVCFLWMNL